MAEQGNQGQTDRIRMFLENMVKALTDFADSVETAVGSFFNGLLECLERIHNWLLTTAQRIWDDLAKLLPALGQVILALTKLSLFYVPFFIPGR